MTGHRSTRNPALVLTAGVAALLAACGPTEPQDPVKAAAAERASLSRADPRMPGGFPIFLGPTGEVREFEIMPAGANGQIATFSVVARPWTIREFYEEEGVARGYEVIGRVNGGMFQSIDLRKVGEGTPHTVSVLAVHKGEYTNVTVNFDVTPG